MSTRTRIIAGLAAVLLAPVFASAQMTPWFQWTFLPGDQMDLIVGEASGETAYSHVLALGGVPRDRDAGEYAEAFSEARYIFDRLKGYGLSDADIVRFPGGETWDGEGGELWEIAPRVRKHASYTDLRVVLASGSTNADVTAELVWAGDGEEKDLEGLDVENKIVVTSGPVARVHALACLRKGAAGVVSYSSPRPLFDPLLIPWQGISGEGDVPAKFAFLLPPREGVLLRDRLRRGERIIVRARVRSSRRAYELEDIVATIPGTDPASGEIILTAHVFEGFEMQGANDNASGCGAILEVARTLRTLIGDKRLPAPRRTIRFLWAYEGRGTAAYVNSHKSLVRTMICNINCDMVGLRLSRAGAFFSLMRTSYGNPHFINDVMENYYRFVGETSRTYVNNGPFSISEPRIVALSGSEEPMPYYMGTHYGSSDHEVFNDWGVGVPGVVMNTWPDPWLHSSADRPDKIDPTQLKRAVVIAAAAAYTIASADDGTAGRIAGEIVSNASARIGHQLARGLEELNRAGRDAFAGVHKKARAYIEAAAINERSTLDTVLTLASDRARLAAHLVGLKASVIGIERSALGAFDAASAFAASRRGGPPIRQTLSPLESELLGIIPAPSPKVREGGFEGYLPLIGHAADTHSVGAPARGRRAVEAEIRLLCNGRNNGLDIKKMLDTQFPEETSPDILLAYLKVLNRAGLVTF